MQKQKPAKSKLERLAPLYLVLALALFGSLYLVNRPLLRYQSQLIYMPWVWAGAVCAVIPYVALIAYEKLRVPFGRVWGKVRGAIDGRPAFYRLIAGLILLSLPVLYAAGVNFPGYLRELYFKVGLGNYMYSNEGWFAADTVSTVVLRGGFCLGIYLILIRGAHVKSWRSLVTAIVALVVGIPLSWWVLILSFAHY